MDPAVAQAANPGAKELWSDLKGGFKEMGDDVLDLFGVKKSSKQGAPEVTPEKR